MLRTVAAELLDSDCGTPEEVSASLADLRRINRWFGGIATTRSMLRQVIAQVSAASSGWDRSASKSLKISILDVGAGSGDICPTLAGQLRTKGIQLQVVLLDRSPVHLRLTDCNRVAGDALALPFRDSSFDVVSCALFAHHLEPDEVVRFLHEALRVARVAVLINDLRRSWTHLAAVYAGFGLYRSRLTRHDAPASVRRAYTPSEMNAMLQQTRARRTEVRNHYLFRMGAIAWKNAPTT